MKKFRSLVLSGLSLLACGLCVAAPLASAATTPGAGSGQALEIAPPLITLSANPGQVIKTQIRLRDIAQGQLLVSEQINDFVAAGEDGTPKILLDTSKENDPFSMRSWVSVLPDMLLSPQQIKTLPVTITVPQNASPGGHYAVIRFTATPPELKGQGVSLSASLGSLMLVTVKGPTTEKLSVAEFSVNKQGKDNNLAPSSLFESTPLTFVERLKNDGNVHEQPVGTITVTDMFGHKVAGLNVNLERRNILPASTRKFTEPLDKTVIGNKHLFGHYTATLHLTYGNNKQPLDAKVSFWIIPWKLIAGIIIVLVGGFFLLRFLLRRYNQRIISKAQGGSTSPQNKSKPSRRRRNK